MSTDNTPVLGYPFASIAAVRAANSLWFSPDTMRWFGSRVETALLGKRYFVTSEKGAHDGDPRRFTIREVTPSADIETVGEFRAYATKQEARAEALRLLAAIASAEPSAAPGEYETPTSFVGRVVAGMVSTPARDYGDSDTPAHDDFGTLGMPRQSVTLADGSTFRVDVIRYPENGHSRVTFKSPHGFEPRHISALRLRGVRLLRELIGEAVRIHASTYNDGEVYMVQGWRG